MLWPGFGQGLDHFHELGRIPVAAAAADQGIEHLRDQGGPGERHAEDMGLPFRV